MNGSDHDKSYLELKKQREKYYRKTKASIIGFLVLGTFIYFYTAIVNWSNMTSFMSLFIKYMIVGILIGCSFLIFKNMLSLAQKKKEIQNYKTHNTK
ncbi:hypothetical protein [Bacillus thuringiensis]|uniref:Uncharacterized protein n=1 Tax=Bacillus thuringiensis Bt18247 TaxID=1423143 RepID=A0A9W3T024_BACTU|nr:hypothetical protein [Bacillus thuringiensis]AOM14536.1 hypothetical protein BTI247_62060 [Bacillus thuringiensis Bt18247]MBG9527947.1 hypothetical protein [Bacillus thuringiensis]